MSSSPRVRRLLLATFVAGSFVGSIATGFSATVLGSSIFSDVDRGSFYDEAIGEMYNAGVIKGYDGTSRFGPNDYVTRGQVAVMLQRFADEYGEPVRQSSSSSRSRSSTSTTSSAASSATSALNNPKGSFRFTTTSYTVSETVSQATVSIVRVGGNDGSVSIDYAVTAGTATAGSDFETKSGTLDFANNETSKTFIVVIKNDTSGEGSETINLTLSNPGNGASLTTPSTAVLTINDDEQPSNSSQSSASSQSSSSSNPNGTLSLSAVTYAANEADTVATIRVNRSGGTNGSVTVSYATSNGTATAGNQYTATNGTLTFGAGETVKSFTVAVADDNDAEGNKTFNVAISAPTGGANLGSTTSASVMINDNESITWGSGAIKFSKDDYDVTESSGKAEAIVQRTGGASGTVTVNYATTSISAAAGSDYTATSGTLTFAPGETSKIITVPIAKDSNNESDEYFFIDLSGVSSPATLISPYQTTINIFD